MKKESDMVNRRAWGDVVQGPYTPSGYVIAVKFYQRKECQNYFRGVRTAHILIMVWLGPFWKVESSLNENNGINVRRRYVGVYDITACGWSICVYSKYMDGSGKEVKTKVGDLGAKLLIDGVD